MAQPSLSREPVAGALSASRSGEPPLVDRLKRLLGLREVVANPHAEPADAKHLRRSLGFLLGWMTAHGKKVNPAHAMLLSDDKAVNDCAVALIARQVSGWRPSAPDAAEELRRQHLEELERVGALEPARPDPPEVAGPAPDIVLDLESALRIALLDCEGQTAPVTATTVQSVEDLDYPGYRRRRRRRTWLVLWTLGALFLATTAELISRAPTELQGRLTSGPDEVYALESLRFFMWGVVGAGLYLLRRLYEFVRRREFDPAMYGMYGVRLLMGGMAGMLIAGMFLPGFANAEEPEPLFLSAVAVLSGFGVRVVYAIFEALIETLSQRIAGKMPA
ncbi:MAG: hypothetical protein QNK04_02155 [Myxococcota bacterium]|nr:hypothetical protein [Myxococcota bacterium]